MVWALRLRWILGCVALEVLFLGAAVPASAATAPQLGASRAVHGGDTATTWSDAGTRIRLAGPAGIKPSFTMANRGAGRTAHGSARLEFNMPVVESGGGVGHAVALDALHRYASSGRSVYDEALAVGFTTAQAAATAKALGISVPGTASKSAVSDAKILGSACANVTNSSHLAVHDCLLLELLQSSGSHWYLGLKISASARYGGGENLFEFSGYSSASQSNNSLASYSPQSTVPITNNDCTTETASLGYNGTGLASTETVCPDNWGPYFNGNAGFGSIWKGCSPDDGSIWEGAPSVSVMNDPDGGHDYIGIHALVGLNGCGWL
jgi:hypothetical protein